MQTRSVETITSNEEYVRLRIFDGDLQISEAAAELLRLERAQHEAERQRRIRAEEALALVSVTDRMIGNGLKPGGMF